MNSLLNGLESEKIWIDNHPEYYRDHHHQDAVKRNIETRYRLTELLTKINKVLPDE